MELNEFVQKTICSVMRAINETSHRLEAENLGKICYGNITTLGKDLVNVRLIKVDDPGKSGKSLPAILFEFEVNFMVEEKNEKESSKGLSATTSLFTICSVAAKAGWWAREKHKKTNVQKLSFTIPVMLKE